MAIYFPLWGIQISTWREDTMSGSPSVGLAWAKKGLIWNNSVSFVNNF